MPGPLRRSLLLLAASALATVVSAQIRTVTKPQPARAAASPAVPSMTFTDVTRAAGIRFRHTNGAFGEKYLPETLGSGVAFLDADADGWQDLFFVNSTHWPGQKGLPSRSALYRNRGDGTFEDITVRSGLDVDLYGIGVAAADYDSDDDVDLYVTVLGRNRLFRNDGGGRFADVTSRAGVGDPGLSTCAVFVDYDRDGDVDLFVCNYVTWSIETDLHCTLDGKRKSYCTPESYKGQSATFYRNRGDGTFEDVTRAAMLYDPTSKALGATLIDFDGDSWMDLFVANDTEPNKLYRNERNGTFTEIGVVAGVAFNEAGVARAGMGVDAADYDGSGRPSLVIGNFSNEMMALYTNEGNGLFIDEAPATTIGRATLLTLTFACFFFDYDLDGFLDIFAANGHVADDIETVQPNVKYAQPAHLFRNLGGRRFEEVTGKVGRALTLPVVGRGAAYGDYDNDGDLDLVITTNNGPPRLLRNDGGNANNWLRLLLRGSPSNRDAIGAKVQLVVDGKPGPWKVVKSGSSYASQSELPLTFGLGRRTQVSGARITWPDGQVESLPALKANRVVTVEQGRGVVRSERLLVRREQSLPS
ncbi:MAG: CRTAC1 family protein [Acidobacteria bacterium]|nr:CRTAC1 family protein [Acidobacteriota bacterium]